jgi:hypothetical protein
VSKVRCDLNYPCSKCCLRGKRCIYINDPEISRQKKLTATRKDHSRYRAFNVPNDSPPVPLSNFPFEMKDSLYPSSIPQPIPHTHSETNSSRVASYDFLRSSSHSFSSSDVWTIPNGTDSSDGIQLNESMLNIAGSSTTDASYSDIDEVGTPGYYLNSKSNEFRVGSPFQVDASTATLLSNVTAVYPPGDLDLVCNDITQSYALADDQCDPSTINNNDIHLDLTGARLASSKMQGAFEGVQLADPHFAHIISSGIDRFYHSCIILLTSSRLSRLPIKGDEPDRN